MNNKNKIIIGVLAIAVALLSAFVIYTYYYEPAGTTLLASFETGGDDVPSQNGTFQQAQTFITDGSWKITKISVLCRLDKSNDRPGVIYIDIKNAGVAGPAGASLASSTYNGNLLTTSDAWIDFDLSTDVQLLSGMYYAITIGVTSDGLNFIVNDADSYALGTYFMSVDSGTTWFEETGDMYFRVYGYA